MQIVTAAVMEKEGKILIAKRGKGDHFESKWELPGGKLEAGETLEECLQRELFEEFGIETRIGECIGENECEYSHMSIRLVVYRAFHITGEFVAKVHETIRWVMPHELDAYDFSEADRPIVRKLKEGL